MRSLNNYYKYCVLVPIVLSCVVHLYNPSGFPGIHPDESDYIRKSMHVLAGLGPQENSSDPIAINNQPYTHPHFGQFFLAALLGSLGYPNWISTESLVNSVGFLYDVPRLLMGILAAVDTFILYKIAERRYSRAIALVASTLFAVMPVTLLLRQVYLENILLPFFLSSILIAFYVKSNKTPADANRSGINNIGNYTLIILSGIMLGIAIYTKIPLFAMIPIVGYTVFMNSGKRLKIVALWLIPVIAIPFLWPAYAMYVGEFDLWMDGIKTQQARLEDQGENKLLSSFKNIYKIDPISLILGIAGLIFAAVKRDYWLLLWVIPFLVLSYFLWWVIYFHLIPILPAFYISAALLIVRAFKFSLWKRIIAPTIISAIICFGLIASVLLITLNVNSNQFQAYAFIVNELKMNSDATGDNKTKIPAADVLVGHRMFYWVPTYVFKTPFDTFPREYLPSGWNKSHTILVATSKSCCCQCPYFKDLYRNTEEIKLFNQDLDLPNYYPYTGIISNPSLGKKVSIRTN